VNPEIKKMWVDALRNGEYQQGYNYLAVHQGESVHFCCLGVLCDLAKQRGVIDSNQDEYGRYSYGTYSNFTDVVLPKGVQEWAGLTVDNPELEVELNNEYEEEFVTEVRLSELNDDHGFDFEKLANLIEKQL
jgi:hypothetical protein